MDRKRNINKDNNHNRVVRKKTSIENINNNEKKINRANKIHKEKKNKKKRNIGFGIFKIFLFTCIALAIIAVGIVAGILTGIIDDTESLDVEYFETTKLTSYIYDKDGKVITSLYQENRVIAKYSDLPQHLIDAVTSIEDARFFEHNGIDIKRTASATISYVLNGGHSTAGGGSTLTQQLIKNVTGDNDTHWTRKIREWYRAIMLETKLSKEQIIEKYLNTIYLGAGSHGVEVASQNYFAKPVSQVSVEEAACLAAIIQLPESYNPYRSEEAKAALLERKNLVLDQMCKYGKLTQEECDAAKAREVVFKKAKSTKQEVNSYFVDAVIEQVITDIMKQKNCTRGAALNLIYGNGYKIYSTQDTRIQKIMEEEYGNPKLFYVSPRYGEMMQSAMVVNDYHTGSVVGMVGGVTGTKSGDLDLNRATQSPRQPGSSIKPLAAYGPAFELGLLTPSRTLKDERTVFKIPGSADWIPKNWYGYYAGTVTVKRAIEQSMNIPAAKTLEMVGIDYSYNFIKNMGITTLDPVHDKGIAALALGGLTNGISTYEMAAAYGAIANGGIYVKPKLYTKVVDKNGKDILVADNTIRQVMKEETSYMLIDCLKSVVVRGTGTAARLGSMPVGGKTGTTNDDKDRWFCGFTPYYSAATWIGYDQPKTIERASYTIVTIWKNVMARIHQNLAVKNFAAPSGLFKTNICSESGLLPCEACIAAGTVVSDMFASDTAPKETCGVHKFVEVCAESGHLPSKYCTNLKKVVVTGDKTITEACKLHLTPPVIAPEPDVDTDIDEVTDKKPDPDTDKKPETDKEPEVDKEPDTDKKPDSEEQN